MTRSKIHFMLIIFLALENFASSYDFLSSSSSIDIDKLGVISTDPKELFNKETAIKDTKTVAFDDTKTQRDLMDEMGFGWNMGNTMDAYNDTSQNEGLSSERLWGAPYTTEEMIGGVQKVGFKTFRLPVTWHNHLIDSNYTIDPQWMARVKTIVDWGIKKGLYVILNTHHDMAKASNTSIEYGKGYYPLKIHQEESERYLYNIWKQITLAFNNGYDHHLIFEFLNEPRLYQTSYEWEYKKGEATNEEAWSVLNSFYRVMLKAVRESGGNNEKRFVMITGLSCQPFSTLNADVIFPSDTQYNPTNNKIFLSIHMYYPYNFAYTSNMTYNVFTDDLKKELYLLFKKYYENYVLRGHYVILGEMACVDKNNSAERKKWGDYYIRTARKFSVNSIIWDTNGYNDQRGTYGTMALYNKRKVVWVDEGYVKNLTAAGNEKLGDIPIENFTNNYISSPVLFTNWKNKIYLDKGDFENYNGYCRMTFNSETNQTGTLKINTADWKDIIVLNDSEVNIGKPNARGALSIVSGNNTVNILLSHVNLAKCRNAGLALDGTGEFTIKKIYISGPRLTHMNPIKISRSNNKQKLSIYFNSNAKQLSNNIRFENFYYNMNNQVKCTINSSNNKVIICEGIFNFTGEFFIKDNFGYLLSNRFVTVVANKGEKNNINNLLDCKVKLDESSKFISIYFNKNLFKDMNANSILSIETEDLFITPAFKDLRIYSGNNTTNIIKFDSQYVNTTVNTNGSITVPNGRQIINFKLTKNYNTFINEGITISGYGFSVNSVYFNEKIKITNKVKKSNGAKTALIVIAVIAAIGVGVFLLFTFCGKRMKIDSLLNKIIN